jgi:branched-chain amino acid transport system permease protein
VLRSRTQLLALLGVTAALATLPLFVTGALRTIAVRVLLAAGLGVAWNVMGGYGGHFSFGHAAYFGIGAYSGAVLVVENGISPWLGMGLGAVLAGAFGAVTGWLAFRYRLKGAYFALATFAFAEMLRLIAMNQEFLNASRGLRVPVLPEASWWMLQFPSGSANYYLVILAIFVAIQAATILLTHSRTGLFIVATRENESGAEAAGVHTMRFKVLAVAISAAMTAVLGVFHVQFFFFINPDLAFGPAVSIAILLPAIIGGTGTIWGPVVGGLILIPLGEAATRFVRNPPSFLDVLQGQSGVDLMILALLLILIILFLPRGVYGSLRERFR